MRADTELTTESRVSSCIADILDKGNSGRYKAKDDIKEIILGGYNPKLVGTFMPDLLSLGADPELELKNSESGNVVDASRGGGFQPVCPFHEGAHRQGQCPVAKFKRTHARGSYAVGYKCGDADCVRCKANAAKEVVPDVCNVCECFLCMDGVTGDNSMTEVQVGLDGSGRVIELRPRACVTPQQFTAHLKELMHTAVRRVAACYGTGVEPTSFPFGGAQNTIGCHFHIGGARAVNLCTDESARAQRTLSSAVVAMRYFIYDWLAPYTKARNGNDYDTPSRTNNAWVMSATVREIIDRQLCRAQNHGIEYRELPSFLVRPGLVEAAIGITMAIWRSATSERERAVKLSRGVGAYESLGIPRSLVKVFFEELKLVADSKLKSLPEEWGVSLSDEEKTKIEEYRKPRESPRRGTLLGTLQGDLPAPCGRCEADFDNGEPHDTTPHEASWLENGVEVTCAYPH